MSASRRRRSLGARSSPGSRTCCGYPALATERRGPGGGRTEVGPGSSRPPWGPVQTSYTHPRPYGCSRLLTGFCELPCFVSHTRAHLRHRVGSPVRYRCKATFLAWVGRHFSRGAPAAGPDARDSIADGGTHRFHARWRSRGGGRWRMEPRPHRPLPLFTGFCELLCSGCCRGTLLEMGFGAPGRATIPLWRSTTTPWATFSTRSGSGWN